MVRATQEKRREYQRTLYRTRRESYLADKSCVKCGSRDELQVDHIDPTQKVTHRVWLWTEERRAIELAKCQILCVPCHRDKTIEQTYGHCPKHGSSGYRKGCRCDVCRSAERLRMAAWRAKKRNPPSPEDLRGSLFTEEG